MELDLEGVAKTLREWGLGGLIPVFAENGIDDPAFELLDEATIRELIPRVGDRLKFSAKFSKWKDASDGVDTIQLELPVEVSYTCFKCLKKINGTENDLFKHLKFVHSINTGTATHIVCHQVGCQKQFLYMKTYKKHVLSDHPSLHSEQAEQVDRPEDDDDNVEGIGDMLQNEHEVVEAGGNEEQCNTSEIFQTSLKHEAALFLASLKGTTGVPTSTVNKVAVNVEDLMGMFVDHVKTKIHSMMDDFQKGSLTENVFTSLLSDFDSLKDTFKEVKTEYGYTKYALERGVLVEPVEKELGHIYDSQINRATGRMEQIRVPETFQYVPIEQTLKAYLQQPGMMSTILNFQKNKEAEIGVLKSYQDSEFFQSFVEDGHEVVLPILLYSDDFETANPLGSRRGVHKLCAYYLTVMSLPKEHLSCLSSILLVALAKSRLVAKYGIDSVQHVIVEDLQRLYDNGIIINNHEFNGCVRPKLFQVVGDNLGIHAMLGYSCGFTANYPCRTCKAHRSECREQEVEDDTLLRSKRNYAEDIETNNLSETGIARNSCLNRLSYYHVVDNGVPDLMHDLEEGVLPLEVKLVLKELIDQNFFNLEELNSRIASFSYGFTDVKNRPSPVSASSLSNPKGSSGQKAVQMQCLFLYLPLICGDLVNEDSEYWELLLTLQDIYKILLAPSVSVAATFMLQARIQDHHSLFKELFPTIHLTPKQHHMVHYAQALRRFGPLSSFSCIRFEGKHKPLKNYARTSNNYIKVEKTVAKKHQIGQSHKFLLKEGVGSRNTEVLSQDVVPAVALSNAEIVCPRIACDIESYVTLASAVVVNGYRIRPHTTVLLCWSEELPQFGEIQQIVIVDSQIHLIVQPWITMNFNRHFHAYAVKTSTDTEVQVITPKNLGCHRPVHSVKSYSEADHSLYIPTRFQMV